MSLTITTRRTLGAYETEHTLYVQGDRSREEFRPSQGSVADDGTFVQTFGPRLAIVRRCDIGRVFSIDLDAGDYKSCRQPKLNGWFYRLRGLRYFTHPWQNWKETRERPATTLIETTTVDTGERKEVFGFTARRVTTTVKQEPLLPSARDASTTTSDGWYIDIDPTIVCERLPPGTRAFLTVVQLGEPTEVPQFKDIGPRETGYPVDVTSVHNSNVARSDGMPETVRTSRTLVTHLSTAPLDPSLFEIPAGFRKRR